MSTDVIYSAALLTGLFYKYIIIKYGCPLNILTQTRDDPFEQTGHPFGYQTSINVTALSDLI